MLEAYREYALKGYNQAVANGYSGANVAVKGASCVRQGDANYSCTVAATVDEPGAEQGNGAPTEVTYPVSIDGQGCWTAMREDQYADQTTFSGCVP